MSEKARHGLLTGLVVLVVFALRTWDIAARPMHADEANQAVKTGELLETGRYAYDPRDHHGPTLYYAALPIAGLRGQHSLAALDETSVRLVPALVGTASIVLLWLLAAPLGRWAALTAASFLAVSPPAVYYSRYFIQETLLLTFTLAAFVCAQRWWRTGLARWAVAAGGCAGLMLATKVSAWLEWRLDKTQNLLGEGAAAFGVGEAGAHDLPGEAAHCHEDFFDAAMLGDGFSQPVSLFFGEGEADGFRFNFG